MKMMIGQRGVGGGQPCFIIAEAGVNHNGSLDLARDLVDIAVAAHADAVKFQTFKSESVCAPSAPKAVYQTQATATQESQLEMVRKLELPFEAFRELQVYCNSKDILFLSTPFDDESADFLAELGVPVFKISSGEITNLPFIEYVAKKRRPLILSTGMSTLDEVATAVGVIRATGNDQFALLQCVSNYPAQPASANLRAMGTMAEAFGVPVGYSDHTVGSGIAYAAVAMGACILEKHFTSSHDLAGPDHRASLEPHELAALVRGIRDVEAALGNGCKQPAKEEGNTMAVARRSLVAATHLREGTILTEEMIAILRPGTGLPPAMRSKLVGRRANQPIEAGTLITLNMLQ